MVGTEEDNLVVNTDNLVPDDLLTANDIESVNSVVDSSIVINDAKEVDTLDDVAEEANLYGTNQGLD